MTLMSSIPFVQTYRCPEGRFDTLPDDFQMPLYRISRDSKDLSWWKGADMETRKGTLLQMTGNEKGTFLPDDRGLQETKSML